YITLYNKTFTICKLTYLSSILCSFIHREGGAMNLEKYIGHFIDEEFGDAEHQIWKFRGAGERAQILKSYGGRENGRLPQCKPDNGRYYVKRDDAITELHF